MLLAVVNCFLFLAVLASSTSDDRMPSFIHEIHKRSKEDSKDCEGETVADCQEIKPKELKSCQICGLLSSKGIEHTIIKGEDVDPPNLYPWMVALHKNNKTTCGGVLVSDTYILTAAHCIKNSDSARFRDEGGETFFKKPDEVKVAFVTSKTDVEPGPDLEEIIPHPLFASHHMKHDIALLKLKKKITCDEYKNPICLPPKGFWIPKDTLIKVAGWGAIGRYRDDDDKKQSELPGKLLEGQVKEVEYEKCAKVLPSNLESSVYCVSGVNDQTPCKGDSGGPMFISHKNKFIVLGLTSMHTATMCKVKKPATFTAIPNHLIWINKVTGIPLEEEEEEE